MINLIQNLNSETSYFERKLAVNSLRMQLNLCPARNQAIFWQKHLPMSDFHLPVVIQFVKKTIYLAIGFFFFFLICIYADLLICSNAIWKKMKLKYVFSLKNNIWYSEIGFVPA